MSFPFARESPENNEVCPFHAVSLEADKIKKIQKRNKQGHEGNVYCTPSSLQVRIKKNKLKKN